MVGSFRAIVSLKITVVILEITIVNYYAIQILQQLFNYKIIISVRKKILRPLIRNLARPGKSNDRYITTFR